MKRGLHEICCKTLNIKNKEKLSQVPLFRFDELKCGRGTNKRNFI